MQYTRHHDAQSFPAHFHRSIHVPIMQRRAPVGSRAPSTARAAAFVLLLAAGLPFAAQAQDTTPPSVPTGLVGTAVSPTQINLSWNPSTDNVAVAGYYVYVNDQWQTPLGPTTATSFQHTGRSPNTTYSYRVSSFDTSSNDSAWTATPVAGTTPAADTQAPSVPTGLVATAVSPTQINLSWNPSTDNVAVAGYYVYVNDQWQTPLGPTTATSFQHTGRSPNTTYSFRVTLLVSSSNDSAWTATPVAVTTPAADTQAPSVPTGLVATAVSPTQINLSWNPSTDNVAVAGYYVYVNDQWQTPLGPTTATSFQHTGRSPNTTYSYRVSSFDTSSNDSAWTATPVAVTTPAADTQAPSVPTGLVGTAVSPTQINLTWEAYTY